MMWDNGTWGAGDWVAMSLLMVLFWGLLVGFAVWLIRGRGSAPARTDAARPVANHADEALAERYARGEIDEEEFTHRRAVLHGGRSQP